MQYRVVPISFVVAYERQDGSLVPVQEFCDPKAARNEAIRLQTAWEAEQAASKAASRRFIPPAQRRTVRTFANDVHA